MSVQRPKHRRDLAARRNEAEGSPRHPVLLASTLALVTVGVIVALLTSEISGTGATDVGDSAPRTGDPAASASARPGSEAEAARQGADVPTRNCEATESNPGGTNNYIPDAPAVESLGEGFVITGQVRAAAGCRPLAGVRIQVWLATEDGGETANRATVRTGEDGRYRIETAPTVPQFGEPNIHVAYEGERYENVFIRRVVDLDDERATVNLTLARDG